MMQQRIISISLIGINYLGLYNEWQNNGHPLQVWPEIIFLRFIQNGRVWHMLPDTAKSGAYQKA
jgi:hypothetical protein